MIFSRVTFLCISALTLLTVSLTSGKLVIFNGVNYLQSSDFNYSGTHEEHDVIWTFPRSIQLNIKYFHLNGHKGDFVLVSEQPLLNYDELVDYNNSGGYMNLLTESILTDQGLLLSWKINKTIEAINQEMGTFVLFHTEEDKDGLLSSRFKGFEIEVDGDFMGTTPPPTTADPYLPPPRGEEIYITKFLDCKAPDKFIRELDDFKEQVARIATEFCYEFIKDDLCMHQNVTKSDVNIPGSREAYAGLHYCDTTWKNYDTCVEVYFSIQRKDGYIFSKAQLEQMWDKKADKLGPEYCPYTPPKTLIDMNTIVWIAFFLGVILALSAVLGCAWVQNTKRLFEMRRFSRASTNFEKMEEKMVIEEKEASKQKHFNGQNPITKYLQVVGTFGKKRSTDNPTYEESPAPYAFENDTFEDQEETPYNSRDNTEEHTLYMRGSHENRPSLFETYS